MPAIFYQPDLQRRINCKLAVILHHAIDITICNSDMNRGNLYQRSGYGDSIQNMPYHGINPDIENSNNFTKQLLLIIEHYMGQWMIYSILTVNQ